MRSYTIIGKKSVFRENALLSTYTDDVTARGVLASKLIKETD